MFKIIKDFFGREIDIVISLIISIGILFLLIFKLQTIFIYGDASLSNLLFSVFGSLFGLLLTSYAILFGLIPVLPLDVLNARILKGINIRFFLALLFNLIIIILGLVIKFNPIDFLIYSQLFFVSLLLIFFFFIIVYLFLLFIIAKNERTKKKKNINQF